MLNWQDTFWIIRNETLQSHHNLMPFSKIKQASHSCPDRNLLPKRFCIWPSEVDGLMLMQTSYHQSGDWTLYCIVACILSSVTGNGCHYSVDKQKPGWRKLNKYNYINASLGCRWCRNFVCYTHHAGQITRRTVPLLFLSSYVGQ